MAGIIKTYIEGIPAKKFIGIKYSNKYRDEKIGLLQNELNGCKVDILI